MKSRLVIGSRGSRLALTQARAVAELLRAASPGLDVAIEIIQTQGDKVLDAPLAQIGGKGLFTRELEVALLERRVDLAVHSLKDLPTELPAGLVLAATPEREDPHDAFVCARHPLLGELPVGARVGTSSLRRRAQLLAVRADLEIVNLRGNVETRLRKVAEGEVDAAVLAYAGLQRLNLAERISSILPVDVMLPAPGQGALVLEVRSNDAEVTELVRGIADESATAETTAERACLAALEGGCQVPVGALARRRDESTLQLHACVCSVDGSTVLRASIDGPMGEAAELGRAAAARLIEQGAAALIAAIR